MEAGAATSAFRHAPIATAVTTTSGEFVEVNDACAELLGRPSDELASLSVEELTHPDDVAELRAAWQRVLTAAVTRQQVRVRMTRVDGVLMLVSLHVAPVPDNGVHRLVVQLEDVTEQQQREDDLAHRALHDPLTGLPNRALFLDRLTHALARLRRESVPVAVLFVDVDEFKAVNDRFGHAAGDHVLSEIGRRLAHAVRPGDTVARFGGDEFVVLCEDSGTDEGALVADRIVERFSEPVPLPSLGEVTVSCSVGVAVARTADVSPEQLLRDADAAMYRRKSRGSPR